METSRSAIKKLLNYSGNAISLPQTPLRADVFDAIIQAGHDPDDCLVTWLVEGSPLGINRPIEDRGIFPTVADESGYDNIHAAMGEGWSNYSSAEEKPELVQALLEKMETKGWMSQHDNIGQFLHATGELEPILNKLALLGEKPGRTARSSTGWCGTCCGLKSTQSHIRGSESYFQRSWIWSTISLSSPRGSSRANH